MAVNRIILQEVETVVNGRIERKERVNVSWLKQEMLLRHPNLYGEDKEFYLLCAADVLEFAIKAFLAKWQKTENSDYDPAEQRQNPNRPFPEFPVLQASYLVAKGEDREIVPIGQMSDAEIEDKAKQYDAMAEGCREHARQLRRYCKERKVSAVV